MIQRSAAQAQDFDKQTPDQIQAAVDKARPTVGGPEATFAISSYETLARAAQQSITERNKDPAQFAIDSGAGWKPLDLKNPQNAISQLKSRANTQEQVSEQMGVNAPLLTKPETQAFTSFLGSQPPAQRLQTLAALRQGLPSDVAYASLMKQITAVAADGDCRRHTRPPRAERAQLVQPEVRDKFPRRPAHLGGRGDIEGQGREGH